ncbi:MAG TPA: IclR family transcriptional regulator [Friedmanniella sp.]
MTPPSSDWPDEAPRTQGIQSVDRAASILELLGRLGSAGVSEVALALDVHKSTAFRLLAALEGRGLVEQSVSRGKYQLGIGVLRLASAVYHRLSVVQQARSSLERLADAQGETVNLAVERSGWAVNLDQAMGPSPLAGYDWIGNLTPLHATASGKIFLAALTADERTALLGRGPLTRFTDATVVDRARLDTELDRAALSGVASTRGELEDGLNAAAVPVRDHLGSVVASISIAGPAFRFDPTDERVLADLRRAGAAVSERLGHAPSSG